MERQLLLLFAPMNIQSVAIVEAGDGERLQRAGQLGPLKFIVTTVKKTLIEPKKRLAIPIKTAIAEKMRVGRTRHFRQT